MQNLKDEEVMESYKKGEMLAMDELLRRYKNPVYRFVLRISQDKDEAQDITSDVFLKVHEYRKDYQPLGKFSTWIFSIAHNISISRLRKKKWQISWPTKKDDPEELVEVQSPDPSPDKISEKNEIEEILRKCIKELPFLQREALCLREYENLDYKDIAKILKKSLGTVKMLIHRARLNLKERILPFIEEVKGGYNV